MQNTHRKSITKSNPRRNQTSKPDRGAWWYILPALLALMIGIWWLTRQPVDLNDDHYAITLALYRVCNQRDRQGLEPIEALISGSDASNDQRSPSLIAIQAIIDDARENRWERATQNCRQLLEDQVQR